MVTKNLNSRVLYPGFSGVPPCGGVFAAAGARDSGAPPAAAPRLPHFFSCRGEAGLSGTSSRPCFFGAWKPAMGAGAPSRPFVEAREARDGLAEMLGLREDDSADWMEVMEGLGARGAVVREAPTGGAPGGSRGGVRGGRGGPGLGPVIGGRVLENNGKGLSGGVMGTGVARAGDRNVHGRNWMGEPPGIWCGRGAWTDSSGMGRCKSEIVVRSVACAKLGELQGSAFVRG